MDFGEEAGRVGDFVRDSIDQGKVGGPRKVVQAKCVLCADAGLDAVGQAGFSGAFVQDAQHAFLHVYADDFALWTDHAGQGQTEITHGATNVQARHTRLNMRPEDFVRVLKPAPERVEL